MQQGLYVSLCWAITSGEYFFKEVETMEKETKKYRDPFKGMSFNGNPVSKEEYIAAYESYVKRCSGEAKG